MYANLCRYLRLNYSLIISTELVVRWNPDLCWDSSNYQSRAEVRAGTAPHPWSSRISREARGQL
jgi:hypothetical protein